MKTIDVFAQLGTSNKTGLLYKKIENLTNTVTVMQDNTNKTGITAKLEYAERNFPKITVQANNSIVNIPVFDSLEEAIDAMLDDITIKQAADSIFLISVLINAGYQHAVLPPNYPIHMADFDYKNIQNTIDTIKVHPDMLHKFLKDIPEIEINVRTLNNKVQYWCRAYITITEFKDNYYPVDPVQSMTIDSTVDYTMYPDMVINYKSY